MVNGSAGEAPCESIEMQVCCIRYEALSVNSFELRPKTGQALPSFTAGGHVEVLMRSGLVRSYSLVNSPADRGRYVIAVNRDPQSRGGSAFMHEALRVGETLSVRPPRNNFRLAEEACHTVMIAGGIGITPFVSMTSRMVEVGSPWVLHYCARTRQHAAFLAELEAAATLGRGSVRYHFDDERGAAPPDIEAMVSAAPPSSDFYCCGPSPMLDAFADATKGIPPERIHVERFSSDKPAAVEGGFTVQLARSGRSVQIPPGSTILDALLTLGIDVRYSCRSGVCGSCETGVLEGVPDHRDLVLSEEQRASGTRMMICCSGARSERLILDL